MVVNVIKSCGQLETRPLPQNEEIRLLKLQNSCLNHNNAVLSTQAKEQSDNISKLTNKLEILSSKIEYSTSSLDKRFNDFRTTQEAVMNSHSQVFTTTNEAYGNFASVLGIILAAAGVYGLYFVRSYKKREINDLVDTTTEKINQQISSGDQLRSLVQRVFEETDSFRERMDEISSDMAQRTQQIVRAMIDDELAGTRQEVEDVSSDLSAVLAGDD